MKFGSTESILSIFTNMHSRIKKIKALDLFSGVGGSSLGAIQAGAEVIAGIDLWETATSNYKRNLPSVTVFNQDLLKISPKKLRQQVGNIDLIIASPECTNHSCAKGGAPKCEDSRMTAFQVIRFAKEFRPKRIVIENLIRLKLWIRHDELVEKLRELGYFARADILGVKGFGVP